ncbi:MAG: hypothetical protein M0007_08400, partial [Actinomycetota bacterium]|nr:hypothetical protein [Actinomycetota bacterium]
MLGGRDGDLRPGNVLERRGVRRGGSRGDRPPQLRTEADGDARARDPRSRAEQARQLGAKGLAWFRIGGDGGALTVDSPLDKFLSDDERAAL